MLDGLECSVFSVSSNNASHNSHVYWVDKHLIQKGVTFYIFVFIKKKDQQWCKLKPRSFS